MLSRSRTGLRQNTWRHTLRMLAASEQSYTDSRRQFGAGSILGGAQTRSEWEVGRIYPDARQSGAELRSYFFRMTKCLGMNPNFSGSDYGFWHNSGKARMTLQENATTGSRPARKFTPANIQKIKDWVEEGISREEIAKSLHVTVGSLQVTCSKLGISLRRRDPSGPGGPRTVRPPYLPSHPPIAGQRHTGMGFKINLECNGTGRKTELPLTTSAIVHLKLEAEIRN